MDLDNLEVMKERLYDIDNLRGVLILLVGGYTLGIYYIHFFIISVLSQIQLFSCGRVMIYLVIFLYSVGATIASYILSKLSLKNRITALLIMGKKF